MATYLGENVKAIIFGLSLLPLAVFAGEKINKQIEVPENGVIYIENQRGNVNIIGWDQNQFRIEGELDGKAQGYELQTKGFKTQFIVKMPSNTQWENVDDGSKLVIYMPKKSALEFAGVNVGVSIEALKHSAQVDVVNGVILASNLDGDIKLTSVNGNISTLNLNGKIEFETVNGDINDRQSSGELRFSAVNGGVKSHTAAKNVHLENVNGSVDFTFDTIKDLHISTVNGEVGVRVAKLLKGADVRFEAVSGNAAFYFANDVSAKFDVQTHANGEILNHLSNEKVKKAKHGPASTLTFSANGGNAQVKMNTISGNIKLQSN